MWPNTKGLIYVAIRLEYLYVYRLSAISTRSLILLTTIRMYLVDITNMGMWACIKNMKSMIVYTTSVRA